MTKKKSNKKLPSLKPVFEEILVCKKKENKPFIEILIEEPQNVSRQNLGTLVGIFQIDDYSEDSSYIVNYLISIIKKEYFTRPNHGVIESFEAALHKANLALSKLASHENIGWIGHLNAVCAVIEKNNLLLSQTGNASALLLRGKTLTEITEKTPEQANLNPLKTFQDVISGRIEKNDKLLFATKELFDLFSLEEIKRSALKFDREKFVRFLDTATVNELDQSAVLVVEIEEKKEDFSPSVPIQNSPKINAFSQKTFRKESPVRPEKTKKPSAKHQDDFLINQEKQGLVQLLKKDSTNFVDEKTGHIYIKEESIYLEKDENNAPIFAFAEIINKFTVYGAKAGQTIKKNSQIFSNSTKTLFTKTKERLLPTKVEKRVASLEASLAQKITAEKEALEPAKKIEYLTPKKELFLPFLLWIKKLPLKIKQHSPKAKEKLTDLAVLLLRGPVRLLLVATNQAKLIWNKLLEHKFHLPTSSSLPKHKKNTPPTAEVKKEQYWGKAFWPSFSRLLQIAKDLDKKQRYAAFLIALGILIVPYWIANWRVDQPKKTETTVVEYLPPEKLPLEKDKNVFRIEKVNAIHPTPGEKITTLNSILFVQTGNTIIQPQDQKEFPLPEGFENPELFFGMEDLNLLFVVKDNHTISLSPITGKFQPNTLAFPIESRIADAKTYLTYVYLLDSANNQIYRIPRAEGGFGEKTDWLKETLNLSEAKSLAINENIFLLNGNNILKLFRGKKIEFSLEDTETPILPDKLYAENSDSVLYVLDKTNARIVKLDNNGQILAQFHHKTLSNATDFSVSAENNLVYISDEEGVKSFEMSQ